MAAAVDEEFKFLPGTPECVREAIVDGDRWIKSAEPILLSGARGTVPCLRCQADAAWERDGRAWAVKCAHCDWGAAGSLAQRKVHS